MRDILCVCVCVIFFFLFFFSEWVLVLVELHSVLLNKS
jgi:hypothetical protein